MGHQELVGRNSLIEEHEDSHLPIANKDGGDITLHPDAWWALSGYGKACM